MTDVFDIRPHEEAAKRIADEVFLALVENAHKKGPPPSTKTGWTSTGGAQQEKPR